MFPFPPYNLCSMKYGVPRVRPDAAGAWRNFSPPSERSPPRAEAPVDRAAYHVGPLSMALPAVDECAVPSALPAKRAVPVAFEGRK